MKATVQKQIANTCSVSRDGAEVLEPLANKHWAYEMTIADPDGNVLWLGDEPRS